MIETGFPKTLDISISKLFFLAPALHDTESELLGTFSFDSSQISQLNNIAKKIYIYHSSDDHLVPLSDSVELYGYFSNATFRQFSDKGHFYTEAELPEIVKDIKN